MQMWYNQKAGVVVLRPVRQKRLVGMLVLMGRGVGGRAWGRGVMQQTFTAGCAGRCYKFWRGSLQQLLNLRAHKILSERLCIRVCVNV